MKHPHGSMPYPVPRHATNFGPRMQHLPDWAGPQGGYSEDEGFAGRSDRPLLTSVGPEPPAPSRHPPVCVRPASSVAGFDPERPRRVRASPEARDPLPDPPRPPARRRRRRRPAPCAGETRACICFLTAICGGGRKPASPARFPGHGGAANDASDPIPCVAAAAGFASMTAPASARHPEASPRSGFTAGFGAAFDRPPPPERPRAPGALGAGPSRVHPAPHPDPGRAGFGRGSLVRLLGAAGWLVPRLRPRREHDPAAPAARPTGLTPADYRAYGGLLADVHAACNAQDLDALGGLATPEMIEHFGDRFASDVYDVVTGVRVRRMRPVRVWSEEGLDHATIHMRYSMTAGGAEQAGNIGRPSGRPAHPAPGDPLLRHHLGGMATVVEAAELVGDPGA